MINIYVLGIIIVFTLNTIQIVSQAIENIQSQNQLHLTKIYALQLSETLNKHSNDQTIIQDTLKAISNFENTDRNANTLNYKELWLINEDQEIIASTMDQINGSKYIYEDDRFTSSDYEPLLSGLITMEEDSLIIGDSRRQSEVISSFSVIPETPNWRLLMISEFEEINSLSGRLIKIASILFFVLIIISLLLSNIITGITLNPILLLTEASDNNQKVSISNTVEKRSDEVTRLFNSYNHMVKALKDHSEHLEQQVQERTLELQQANQQLYNLATTDALTGSMNRLQILNKLKSIIDNVNNLNHASFSILFIDLNNFKYYNDTFGHDIGDLLLMETLRFLKQQFRESDYIGRYGGDEFIVILPGAEETALPRIIDHVLSNLKKEKHFQKQLSEWLNQAIEIPEDKLLGFSIGKAVYNSDNPETADELIKRADEAMYIEKKKTK